MATGGSDRDSEHGSEHFEDSVTDFMVEQDVKTQLEVANSKLAEAKLAEEQANKKYNDLLKVTEENNRKTLEMQEKVSRKEAEVVEYLQLLHSQNVPPQVTSTPVQRPIPSLGNIAQPSGLMDPNLMAAQSRFAAPPWSTAAPPWSTAPPSWSTAPPPFSSAAGIPSSRMPTSSTSNAPLQQQPLLDVINQWERTSAPRPRFQSQMNGGMPTYMPPSVTVPRGMRNEQHSVPLPRQMLYDGKTNWEGFIVPFQSLAAACNWTTAEKLFRLSNALRGDASEYAFTQLPKSVVDDYESFVLALETRYKEKRTTASYLAELESRKLDSKEQVSEYIATIKKLVLKAYPTADAKTRETIGLRHFLKGLPDQQMAIAVGMKNPKNLEDAREALDTYTSLRDEVNAKAKVRAVQSSQAQPSDGNKFVTEERLQSFGKELKDSFKSDLSEIKELLKGGSTSESSKNKGNNNQYKPKKDRSCYNCGALGHYAKECTSPKPEVNAESDVVKEKN